MGKNQLVNSVTTSGLSTELQWLNLRLLRAVQSLRTKQNANSAQSGGGLSITDWDVDQVLYRLVYQAGHVTSKGESYFDTEVENLKSIINENTNPVADDRCLLSRIAKAYSLSEFERFILTICLSVEIDREYGTIFGYLNDDATKKLPTLGLALDLFSDYNYENNAHLSAISSTSKLVVNRLIYLPPASSTRESSRLDQVLKVSERVSDYFLGSQDLPSDINEIVHLQPSPVGVQEFISGPNVLADLRNTANRLEALLDNDITKVIQLVGKPGTGKKTAAVNFFQDDYEVLLVVDLKALIRSQRPPVELLSLILREAVLQQANIYWDNFQELLIRDTKDENLLNMIQDTVFPKLRKTFVGSSEFWYPLNESIVVLTIEIPVPTYLDRIKLWAEQLRSVGVALDENSLRELAAKFELTGLQIKLATRFTQNVIPSSSGVDILDCYEDLLLAARKYSNTQLRGLAQVIEAKHTWDQLVLPGEQIEILKEICSRYQYGHVVYDQWGFQSFTARGRGLNILFSGPSGTGKTMSAEVIAGELGLDLYKIELSSVVSKYIGETEKNLDVIFREAEGSNAILLFDEADSIFGKRSEVKDAHDRYANLEVSYLLQKMEDYRGIAILTTNFRRNMDEAFLRRMHCAVEFPFPEEDSRMEIWKRMLPSEAPLNSDVDLRFMSRQFKMAGGNIKNVAVTAAFYAAEESSDITMAHMIKGTKREFQKLGRLVTEGDFGPYFKLVKTD